MYNVPVSLLLLCNLVFLVWIMVVVVGKLRSDNSESHHQHWKAAKALLVIIPLLGITYLITLMPPTADKHTTGHIIFQDLRAVLLSTQVGFFVCALAVIPGRLNSSPRWRT